MPASFSAKLAAFMLNGLTENVKCGPTLGFERFQQTEVLGLLPYLHLNITQEEYTDILKSTQPSMTKVLTKICKDKKLDTSLKAVGFKCSVHSKIGADVLINRMIDTINVGYSARLNGKKKAAQMAAFMKMQNKKGNIPAASVEWCSGISSDPKIKKFSAVP